MITAQQSAKLRAATHLRTAANEVAESLPLICFTQDERHRLHKVIEELHDVFALLISNSHRGD